MGFFNEAHGTNTSQIDPQIPDGTWNAVNWKENPDANLTCETTGTSEEELKHPKREKSNPNPCGLTARLVVTSSEYRKMCCLLLVFSRWPPFSIAPFLSSIYIFYQANSFPGIIFSSSVFLCNFIILHGQRAWQSENRVLCMCQQFPEVFGYYW